MNEFLKKNILYLCEGSGFAGAESYALSLIREIASYKDMNCIVATFYNGPLTQHLYSEPVVLIDLYGRKNIKSICRIVKLIKSEKIDIIHCVDLKSTIVGGLSSLFYKNIKIVATIHGLPEYYKKFTDQFKYVISLLLYFTALRFLFDGKICVSRDLMNRIEKIIGTKKNKVIHNGIELISEDASGHSRNIKKNIFTIGTVGRLDTVKGHVYLLEAAKKLLAERDDVSFQIIGTGPLDEYLIEKTLDLGISDSVHFLGFRPDAKYLISKMDIFVLPSLHEGIPYVLLEAMASSKPVICTAVGGINEIITNGKDGILIRPKDSHELYTAIKRLLLSENYRIELGENGRDRVGSYFTSGLMAKNTHKFYGDILSE